jgi:hypothetical protein
MFCPAAANLYVHPTNCPVLVILDDAPVDANWKEQFRNRPLAVRLRVPVAVDPQMNEIP